MEFPGDTALKELAQQWLGQGIAGIVVEVAALRGSAPREVGARMLVSARKCVGSVGGGHLEWQALQTARAALQGEPLPEEVRFALGPRLGQCCGGEVRLRFSVLSAQTLAAWPVPPSQFAVQLHGAGHVGQAVIRLLAQLPCQVQWVDERDDAFASEPLPDHIQRVATDNAVAEVASASPDSFFLVMTHRHDLDLELCEAILRRADYGFLGLIGSATKRGRFRSRLAQKGFSAQDIDRMQCPIGVAGVVGKQPAVIAVAVVAQLLQRSNLVSEHRQELPAQNHHRQRHALEKHGG